MKSENALNSSGSVGSIPIWRSVVVILLVTGTVGFCLVGTPDNTVSEAGVNMSLPKSVGGLQGTELEVSESELAILPKDTEFAKMQYEGAGSPPISCQIVLAGAEKRSIHRPEVCLPGQGWTLRGGHVESIPLTTGGSLDVMKLDLIRPVSLSNGEKAQLQSLFYYWFVGKDSTTPHHLTRILKTNMDMLLHNKNHRWAYIIVSAPVLKGLVPEGMSVEETEAELEAFIGEMAPLIMEKADEKVEG